MSLGPAVLLMVVAVTVPRAARAADAEAEAKQKEYAELDVRTALTANAAGALIGVYSAELEKAIGPRMALFAEAGVWNTRNSEGLVVGATGGAGTVGARWYVVGLPLRGLFLAPEIQVSYLDPQGDPAALGAAAGLDAGLSYVAFGHLRLMAAVGGSYLLAGYSATGWAAEVQRFAPRARLGIGLAF